MTPTLSKNPTFYFTVFNYRFVDYENLEERLMNVLQQHLTIEKTYKEYGITIVDEPCIENQMIASYSRAEYLNVLLTNGVLMSIQLYKQESDNSDFADASKGFSSSFIIYFKNNPSWETVKTSYVLFRDFFESPGIKDNSWLYNFNGDGIYFLYKSFSTPEQLAEMVNFTENAIIQSHLKNTFNEFNFQQLPFIDFDKLAPQITNKESIHFFRLSDCNLKEFPNFLFECKNVTSIDVYKNQIYKCDERLKELTHLKSITIKENPILFDSEQINMLKAILPEGCRIDRY